VPLEAQACGRPVIALGRGGVLETVVPANPDSPMDLAENAVPTGIFYYEPNPESLSATVKTLDSIAFDSAAIGRNALRFDKPVFVQKLGDYLQARIQEKFGEPLRKVSAEVIRDG
jgi:glycosyltransferase involved in cell wall biosynthesis